MLINTAFMQKGGKYMDLASVGYTSIQMSLAETQQAASISVLKMAMQSQEAASATLVQRIAQTQPPMYGHSFGMYA